MRGSYHSTINNFTSVYHYLFNFFVIFSLVLLVIINTHLNVFYSKSENDARNILYSFHFYSTQLKGVLFKPKEGFLNITYDKTFKDHAPASIHDIIVTNYKWFSQSIMHKLVFFFSIVCCYILIANPHSGDHAE
jgi:hypothetical protein